MSMGADEQISELEQCQQVADAAEREQIISELHQRVEECELRLAWRAEDCRHQGAWLLKLAAQLFEGVAERDDCELSAEVDMFKSAQQISEVGGWLLHGIFSSEEMGVQS